MTRTQTPDFPRVSRVLLGALLAGIGLIVLLDRTGQLQLGSLWHWWPMILVLLGIAQLLHPSGARRSRRGAGLIVLGLWLQACLGNWLGLTFVNSWPLLLVFHGLSIIIQAGQDDPRFQEVENERSR